MIYRSFLDLIFKSDLIFQSIEHLMCKSFNEFISCLDETLDKLLIISKHLFCLIIMLYFKFAKLIDLKLPLK